MKRPLSLGLSCALLLQSSSWAAFRAEAPKTAPVNSPLAPTLPGSNIGSGSGADALSSPDLALRPLGALNLAPQSASLSEPQPLATPAMGALSARESPTSAEPARSDRSDNPAASAPGASGSALGQAAASASKAGAQSSPKFAALSSIWSRLFDGASSRGSEAVIGTPYPVSAAAHLGARASRGSVEDASAQEENIPGELIPGSDDMPALARELPFGYDAKNGLRSSQVYSTIRLIRNSGSRRYWEQFNAGDAIRVLYSWRTLFTSKIEKARTKKIRDLSLEDFEGVYSPQVINRIPKRERLARLQEKLIEKLSRKGVATPDSLVRVLRFMSYRDTRDLPENADQDAHEVIARKTVSIPASLASLDKYLPKLVLLDMRLFTDGVPFELLEDIGKLQAAGVYFLLLSDKPQDAVEYALGKRLNNVQRNNKNMIRFNLLSLSDDGNSLYKYPGTFPAALPSKSFSVLNQEIFSETARRLGAAVTEFPRGQGFTLAPPAGQSATAWAKTFSDELKKRGLKREEYALRVQESAEQPRVLVRPTFLPEAIEHALETLREDRGLYVNPSDTMVISRDADILAATPGAIQPAHMHGASNENGEFVEQSLAAMLGNFRKNELGDQVASYSKLAELDKKGKKWDSGSDDTVFTALGSAVHTAFNWAIWIYRNTGKFPSADEVSQKALGIWDREIFAARGNPVYSMEDLGGYRNALEERLKSMHKETAAILKEYPIVVGTELPDLYVMQGYKKGTPTPRDILRFKLDLVVARQTNKGLEFMVVDWKTGQKPPLPKLAKDKQVLLYDMLVRRIWPSMPLPYGILGKSNKIANIRVVYIYFSETSEPLIDEWDHRVPFERALPRMMNKMRKQNQPAKGQAEPKKARR